MAGRRRDVKARPVGRDVSRYSYLKCSGEKPEKQVPAGIVDAGHQAGHLGGNSGDIYEQAVVPLLIPQT